MSSIESIQTALALGAGGLLAGIQMRWHFKKGLPLIGTLFSKKLFGCLDAIEIKMALLAGFFFICLIASVIVQHW